MPITEDHIAFAEHNEKFVGSFDLDSTVYTDWVVTGMFYAALHYVEAYLALLGEQPEDHRARDSHVKRHMPEIGKDYRRLKDDSINARYYGYCFSADDIRRTVIPNLEAVKTHILNLLGAH